MNTVYIRIRIQRVGFVGLRLKSSKADGGMASYRSSEPDYGWVNGVDDVV